MSDGAQSSGKPTREDLNAKAAELGIANPEGLKNVEAVEAAIAEAEAVPRYSREQVLANARLLTGFSRHFMAGALHGSDAARFTKAEAKRLGERFKEHQPEKVGA